MSTDTGDRLRLSRGSHRTVLNAIVRKLVVLANTLIKQKGLRFPDPGWQGIELIQASLR